MLEQSLLSIPPVPGSIAGRSALKALLRQRNILAALEALHLEMGDVFRIPLPGFNPIVLVGPEASDGYKSHPGHVAFPEKRG